MPVNYGRPNGNRGRYGNLFHNLFNISQLPLFVNLILSRNSRRRVGRQMAYHPTACPTGMAYTIRLINKNDGPLCPAMHQSMETSCNTAHAWEFRSEIAYEFVGDSSW